MNRSLANVIFGGFGTDGGSSCSGGAIEGSITEISADDVASELGKPRRL